MKKKHINLMDILLLVTIAMLIGVTVYRYISMRRSVEPTQRQNAVLTATIHGLDAALSDALQSGDILYIDETDAVCGKITRVNAVYDKQVVTLSDGTVDEHLDPRRVSVTFAVSTTADISGKAAKLDGGVLLIPGSEHDFHTRSISFTANIESVTAIG